MWTDAATAAPDIHVGFRGTFTLDSDARVDLRLSGASWYVVWIDGEYFTEGPDRYTAAYPEYQLRSVDLKKGKHTIAVQLQYEGVVTRILHPIQPFLYLEAAVGGKELLIDWRCQRLAGYSSQVRRINPQLGWIEWLDTRALQKDWQQPAYDDSSWGKPVFVERAIGEFAASKIAPVKSLKIEPKLIASGELAEVFG